jgi:hypothetical protein
MGSSGLVLAAGAAAAGGTMLGCDGLFQQLYAGRHIAYQAQTLATKYLGEQVVGRVDQGQTIHGDGGGEIFFGLMARTGAAQRAQTCVVR